jgi:hypothetical protein
MFTLSNKQRIVILLAAGNAMILLGVAGFRVFAQAARQDASAPPSSASNKLLAPADFPRGAEQIYMIKCWMCHNEFAKTGPPLKDISKRAKLISGEPVNENTVTEKIKAGSDKMPSYRYTLPDQQLSELVKYLLSGKCCPNPDNPPVNPQYRNP